MFRRKHVSLGLLAYKGYFGFALQHSVIVGFQLAVADRYLVEEIGSFDQGRVVGSIVVGSGKRLVVGSNTVGSPVMLNKGFGTVLFFLCNRI